MNESANIVIDILPNVSPNFTSLAEAQGFIIVNNPLYTTELLLYCILGVLTLWFTVWLYFKFPRSVTR